MAKKNESASEPVVIMAYKAFNKDWKCRDFQFEVGKTYTHEGSVVACNSGFHSCENPLDVLNYYNLFDSKFAVVKATGTIARNGNDTKIASASISVEAELKLPEFIAAAVNWIEQACTFDGEKISSGNSSKLAASGYYSQLAASGDSSQLAASGDSSQLAASGYYSKLAASGYYSQLAASGNSSKLAASGNSSKLAASGYYSQLAASGNSSKLAASGDSSQLAASGDSSIAMAAAPNCTAKAGKNGTIALTRWVESEKRHRVSVAYVGENGIKPDTFYKLEDSGNFVEV